MNILEIFGVVTLFAVFLACQTEAAETISGVPRIVDGDTIVIGATKIRLESIDAPESDQICVDENGDRSAVGMQREIGSPAMLATAKLIVLPAAWMPTAAHLQYAGLRVKT